MVKFVVESEEIEYRGIIMLTRGKVLGEILDGLSQLSFTLQTRGKFGLFDLNRYCEDFAKYLLNLIYEYELNNLNDVRLNEPGIDLGDKTNRIAFQITTNKTSAKVKETLEKITDEHKNDYNKFKIFILGTKQSSYTIPESLKNSMNFDESEDILDFQDIESKILSLSIEKIKQVYEFLEDNLIRLYSDLGVDETPDRESTSILSSLEINPAYTFSNFELLYRYIENEAERAITEKEKEIFNKAFKEFVNVLSSLPKITREFFYALFYKAGDADLYGNFELDDEMMRRFLHIDEHRYNQELRILVDKQLINYEEEETYHHTITIAGSAAKEFVLHYIKKVAENEEGIDLKEILVDLKFSLLEV